MHDSMQRKYAWYDKNLMNRVYWMHVVMATVYFLYTVFNRSDSKEYFRDTLEGYENWFGAYSTGTRYIHFLAYPFVNWLQFNYEMMMALFAFFGYLGFVCFYCYFKENLPKQFTWRGFDPVAVVLMLPNMHFWTSSLGKGSAIFLGLGMAIWGLSNPKQRWLLLVSGLLLVYHIRPHVFLFMAVGIGFGFFFGQQKKIPAWQKWAVVLATVGGMVLLYDKILGFAGLDSENVVESFDKFSGTRSRELAKSGSGVDMSNYPLLLKLFTFWFRPLFVDAPNALGIFVSLENLVYILLTIELFKGKFIRWWLKSDALVKSSLVIFIASSVALSTTMSNLGIIIRQKSMVMYFYFFVVLRYMYYRQYEMNAVTTTGDATNIITSEDEQANKARKPRYIRNKQGKVLLKRGLFQMK